MTEDIEKIIDEQTKAYAKQLPDPESCRPYEYLQALNAIIQEINSGPINSKFASAGQIARQSLKSNLILPLDRDEIIKPRILAAIKQYRSGQDIDTNIIRVIVDTYVLLDRMSYSFEEELSKATARHYTYSLSKMIDTISVGELLSFTNVAIENEKKLLEKINIPIDMREEVIRRLIQSVLKDQPSIQQFTQLVHERKSEELKILYQLRKISTNLDHIHCLWREYLQNQAQFFFNVDSNDIDALINMKNEHINIAKECFEGDEEMLKQIMTSLTYRMDLLTKMSAKYVHNQLKTVINCPQSVDELESWMKKVTDLFPYLDMDVFRQLHESYLARRFNSHKQLPIDAERFVLSKIPDIPGKYKLLDDIEENLLLDKKFEEYLSMKQIKLGLVLDVKVIQHPLCIGERSILHYPPELARIINIYNEFYSDVNRNEQGHRKKILIWNYPQHSTCLVVGNFKRGSKQLSVQLQQAVVLLLFNEYKALSFDEIVQKTGISPVQLQQILYPILCSGMILKANISDGGEFRFGKEFFSPNVEFDFTDTSKRTKSVPNAEESVIIQAKIVQLMKRHRQISEAELIREVYAHLAARFRLKRTYITTAISNLTEREYLRRGSDNSILEYLP